MVAALLLGVAGWRWVRARESEREGNE